ncbi:MAG: transglycosylase domain-containing protein [Clostridia bacterium]|nr:transglycosylase domain-containing protein [Clostridia bacterium]
MDNKKPTPVSKKPVSSTQKSKNKTKKSSKGLWTALKLFIIIIILAGFFGAAGVYLYIMGVISDTEPIDPATISTKLTENSVIVDAEGRVLELIHSDGLRTVIRYEDMSQELLDAFVAVEDKTFWTHNGFNVVRLFGAVKDTLTTGRRLGGTSTITQQLARNIYLFEIRSTRSIDRKIKEAYYAIELEKYLKKEQIIEAYLNQIFLGANTNGVEAAAQTYFSKSAKDLDYIESAVLAGITTGPSLYTPMITKNKDNIAEDDYILDNSDPDYTLVYNPRVEGRYLTAIYLMHEQGLITDAEYEFGKNVDLKTKLNPNKSVRAEISSFFADMVKEEVIKDLMELYNYSETEASNMLFTNGLVIESTIDFDIQKTLESHYALGNFTPYYGESTAVAVRAFQRDKGLTADGVAGQNTLGKIGELSGMDMSIFTQDFYTKGNNNDEVVFLKKALFELGYLINNENFPKVTVRLDNQGNILSEESGNIRVYRQTNVVDSAKNLVVPSTEYNFDDAGNLVLLKNRRFYFYPRYENDELKRIQVVLRETYTHNEEDEERLTGGKYNLSDLYTYEGRDLLIPDEYKSFDSNDNVVIAKAFMNENPDFFKIDGDKNLRISSDNYVISKIGVIQPQSAMVIIDYHTGELKAIVGGRNITGQKMYNRAMNPRQPGSAIKPLSVFTPAIDSGRYTAATVVDDRPSYLLGNPTVRWPFNWYESYSSYNKYWGLVNLRESVQWSINVTAAKMVIDLGVNTSLDYLQKFGISTLVTSGPTNDANVASVALGGMTRGIAPVELTNAYGAIANKGVLNKYYTYKTVRNSSGDIIIEKRPEKSVIVDENVAYIVQDMLMTSVNSGVATAAKLSANNDVMPVSGKTGTTSSNIDAWFVGYTPYYVGGVWFGNDLNIPLDQGSRIAAQFWKTVMADVHADLESKAFDVPSGIERASVDRISGKLPTELSYLDPRGTVYSEIFLRGTVPTEEDDVHVLLEICTESGKLITEFCPEDTIASRVFVKRPEPYNPADHGGIVIKDMMYDAPVSLCDIHTEEIIIAPVMPDPTDFGGYIGVKPTVMLATGVLYIQRPYPIVMSDGQMLTLPAGSKVLENDDIQLPDGSIIPSYNVRTFPNYTTEELDAMNP